MPCSGYTNGGIMPFTKRLYEGFKKNKKIKPYVKRDNDPKKENQDLKLNISMV